jgi:hypothetical protein
LNENRERVLNVRLTDDEVRMLSAIAELDGLNQSDWVRRTIRTTFRKAFPVSVQQPAKQKRPGNGARLNHRFRRRCRGRRDRYGPGFAPERRRTCSRWRLDR